MIFEQYSSTKSLSTRSENEAEEKEVTTIAGLKRMMRWIKEKNSYQEEKKSCIVR